MAELGYYGIDDAVLDSKNIPENSANTTVSVPATKIFFEGASPGSIVRRTIHI